MGVSSESLSGKHTLSWKGTHASFLGSKYFGADVAIKQAAPGDSYFKQREMKIVETLKHPNIVQVRLTFGMLCN